MSTINIPRDDLGTLDIKLNNTTSEAITPANQSQPAPDVEESHNRLPPRRDQRRRKDRRKKERRQKQVPVLLDTRVQGDRRHQPRRRADIEVSHDNKANESADGTTPNPQPRIDDYA